MMHELLPWMLAIGKYILASAVLLAFYRVFLRKHASFRESRLFLLSVAFLALAVSQFRIEVTHPAPTIVEVEREMPAVQQMTLLTVADGLSFPLQAGADGVTETAGMSTAGVTTTGVTTAELSTAGVGSFTKKTSAAAKPDLSLFQQIITWIQSHLLQLLLAVYIMVVLTLVINLLLQYRSIRKLRRTGLGSLHEGYTLVEHPEVSTPFSFATTIFLPSNLNAGQRDIVETHERWHIRHKHYVDVLVQEITCCLFWFNPVQWLLRKDLRSAHEFQADRSVLNEGCDVYRYQTVILEEVLGHHFRLANGFNQSFTKKRFIQMKQFEPLRLNTLRKVASVCFLVLLFAALSVVPGKSQVIRVERSSTTSRTENGTTTSVTFRSVDTLSNNRINLSQTIVDPTSMPGEIQRSFTQSVDSQLRMVNRVLPIAHRLARSPKPADNVSDMDALLEALQIKVNNEGISYSEFSQDAKNKLTREAFQGFEKTMSNMRDSLLFYQKQTVNRPDSRYLMGLVSVSQQLFSDNVFNTIVKELFNIIGVRMGSAMNGMGEGVSSMEGPRESASNGAEAVGSMNEALEEMRTAMSGMMTSLTGAMSTQTANPVNSNVDRTEVVRQPTTRSSGSTVQRSVQNRRDNNEGSADSKTAISQLTNQTTLENIARNDEDPHVRLLAVSKLTNQTSLGNIARNDEDKDVRIEAVLKLTDDVTLGNIARNDEDPHVRLLAVRKLTNQTSLGNIARNDDDKDVRIEAVLKLTDDVTLGNVARNDEDPRVRLLAVRKLTNQTSLGNIARNDDDKDVRIEAVLKLTDDVTLGNVARNDEDPRVRLLAVRKLTNQTSLGNIARNDEDRNVRIEAMNRMEQLEKESKKRQPK